VPLRCVVFVRATVLRCLNPVLYRRVMSINFGSSDVSERLAVVLCFDNLYDVELLRHWTEEFYRQVYGIEVDPVKNPEAIARFLKEVVHFLITRDHHIRRIIEGISHLKKPARTSYSRRT